MNTEKIILESDQLSFGYSKRKRLLNDITFQLKSGDITIILGKSGEGKSTILKLLNRLLTPSSGVIRYNQINIQDISPLQLRKDLGYIPQIPYLIEGTVRDNLLLPFYKRDIPTDINLIFIEKLVEVGLEEEILYQNAQELSVGQKQRISIVRSLLNEPKILLMDEPSSALDKENIKLLIQSLKTIVQQEALTLLIVTHNLDFAREIDGRLLYLKDGTIKKYDYPENSPN